MRIITDAPRDEDVNIVDGMFLVQSHVGLPSIFANVTLVRRANHIDFACVTYSLSDMSFFLHIEHWTLYIVCSQRTCNGFVLQMAHFYSKKSIAKKSLQNITK